MKRILSLVLILALALSLAACANTQPNSGTNQPTETQQGGENNPDTTNPTSSSGNDDQSFQWETKEMTAPVFEEIAVEKLTAVEGYDAKASVIVSPWKMSDFSLDDIQATLEACPLFEGYIFGTEEIERGHATNYKDVGFLMSYEWEKQIVSTRNYYDTRLYANDGVEFTLGGNTEDTIGYNDISLSMYVPMDRVNENTQETIRLLLVDIFGEEYGNFLCYAPTVEKNCLLEVQQDNAIIYMRREVYDSDYYNEDGDMIFFFRMHIDPLLGYKVFESFPGNGEYTSIVDTPSYVNQILNENMGDVNVQDYGNIGAAMLKELYGENYEFTISDYTSSYYMRTMQLDNGHSSVSFELNAMAGLSETAKLICPDFVIDYDVVHNGTAVTDVELKFELGVGMDKGDADLEATRTKFFNNGAKALKCVLLDDIDPAEVMVKGEDGKHKAYSWDTNIMGLDKKADMSFVMGETMAGFLVGYIYYNIR